MAGTLLPFCLLCYTLYCVRTMFLEASIIAYSFMVTSGIAVGYVVLVLLESNYSNRVASDFRLYLDTKMVALVRYMQRYMRIADSLYKRGSGAVEADLIDPLTMPITETQKQYTIIKTGEKKIRKAPISRISPYLRDLIDVRDQEKKKKKSKKRVGRSRSSS